MPILVRFFGPCGFGEMMFKIHELHGGICLLRIRPDVLNGPGKYLRDQVAVTIRNTRRLELDRLAQSVLL